MKKIITGLFFLYLFAFFLVYSGFFRNNRDPMEVAKYYFECMRDREWILTYQITKFESFNQTKILRQMAENFKNKAIKDLTLDPLDIKSGLAHIQVDLVYEDQDRTSGVITLEKNERGRWLVKDVYYEG